MAKLNFITISSNPNSASENPEHRRLIRTTATRATRSHKAHEISEKHRMDSDVVRETSLRSRVTTFRAKSANNPTGSKHVVSATPLTISPLSTRVQLWDPVVAPLGDQAWFLLHYYRYHFRARSWAIIAKRDWFAFIIEDPAATHATLSFVSSNRDLEEGSVPSTSTLHHRAKAMQLVRQRLTSVNDSVEDSLIGAVALLAITEGLEGHSSSSALHIQALQRLVDLRGGLKRLHNNEALSRLVAWADLCHTSTVSSRPRSLKLFQSSDLALDTKNILSSTAESSRFQNTVRETMSPEIYDLIKLLAAVPRYPPTDDTSVGERQNTSRLIYHINQLAWSMYHDGPSFGTGSAGRFGKVLCYAAYLYIALVLRQMPRRTKVVLERVRKLRISIEELKLNLQWDTTLKEPYMSITLWVHVILFCASNYDERNETEVGRVKDLVTALRLKDIETLETRLGLISWINGYAEHDLRSICNECHH